MYLHEKSFSPLRAKQKSGCEDIIGTTTPDFLRVLPRIFPLSERISIFIYHFDFLLKVKDLPTQLEKMDELCHLPGFRHDAKLIEETGKSDHC